MLPPGAEERDSRGTQRKHNKGDLFPVNDKSLRVRETLSSRELELLWRDAKGLIRCEEVQSHPAVAAVERHGESGLQRGDRGDQNRVGQFFRTGLFYYSCR